ncbi:hypothetical protein COV24_04320 [candidate division WWE3 bacterium CG10_big_fil_rev_8_21_14_0_10_32_10]|uniref:M23ase beta-sheet core domain-containing protein n=1 Tax=candidate division WWE3 bacterium CG10_big_fil_rev_8_21_14_0_10_32_10 TaxID=1975090 RepID=A0A2H0R9F8_UNCKA|nr:MAG: hypothetical protein COV24_04320 [candidate division WWE3 bacterium CG10_big_fil_rev_8_21_14_0_10_32_10]
MNYFLNIKKFIFIFALSLFVLVGTAFYARAQDSNSSTSNNSDYANQLQNKIDELEKKLSDTKEKENSLKNEIESLQNQISLTQYKIDSTNYQIQESIKEIGLLESDIDFLQNQAVTIELTISEKEKSLEQILRERYKQSKMDNFSMFLSSKGFSSYINVLKYSKVAEDRDRSILKDMYDTQKSYTAQQGVIQTKKDEVETLKAQLESQKIQAENLKVELNDLKLQKDNLLSVTKNDEKKYQEALEAAKKELQQIQGAANIVIRDGSGINVKKGEVIGTMGNSGFSTGAHLHFGVYRYSVDDFQSHINWSWYYSNMVNPTKKLKSKTVYWGTGCYLDPSGNEETGQGDWDWPMSSPTITQNYGSNTCYNWMYGYKPHPALDIVASGDISVRSVADGNAYFCRNCLGDGGNGVFVFHKDNYMTVYWHLR